MSRLYTITGQLQVRGLVNGQLRDLYEIHYAGPNAIEGWVRVPVGSTPDVVDQTIRARLDEQLGYGQLGGNG